MIMDSHVRVTTGVRRPQQTLPPRWAALGPTRFGNGPFTVDFDRGPLRFVAGFADDPPADADIYELTADVRA